MTGILVATAIIALPALAFTLWPLLRGHAGRGMLPVPPDAREQLLEQKRAVLRALRELQFEHESGHVSDDDYEELSARYESEAAGILTDLDRLGAPARRSGAGAAAPAATARRSAWTHPAALAVAAVLLVVFGLVIGAGIVRYTTPDRPATMASGGPAGDVLAGAASAGAVATAGAGRPLTPEVLRGMLEAARQSLNAGEYSQAIAAYQAILKRDPKNVDAITHLGWIVALGGHADAALETFDKALAIDPAYAPAYLYRGQVLYEGKRDAPGAIRAWEKYLTLGPPAEDRERVTQLIADAKRTPPPSR